MTEYSDEGVGRTRDRIEDFFQGFKQSPFFHDLTPEQKDQAEFVTKSFGEHMYLYHGQGIGEWGIPAMKKCCCETFPRKISADDAFFESVGPVLSAFFEFLEDQKVISTAGKFIDSLKGIEKQIVTNSRNPECWGMAKFLFMAGEKSGFDMKTQQGRTRFFEEYNRKLLGNGTSSDRPTPSHLVGGSGKVGRNDPCPCGSGKKFKKCCYDKV